MYLSPYFLLNNHKLKTKVLPGIFYLALALILVSFSDPYTIKRISDADFRYEFYTTDKKINPKDNKMYYWFKGGTIHNSQAGIAGQLLHDKFVKMYHSNQLAESGTLKNGLKTGIWKTWHPNGMLQTIQKWNNGFKTGIFLNYDLKGNLLEKGKFKNNLKQGTWISYATKDTLSYRRGVVVQNKPKRTPLQKHEQNLKEDNAKALKAATVNAKNLEDATKLEGYKISEKEVKKALRAKQKTEAKANCIKTKEKYKAYFKNMFSKKPAAANGKRE